MIYDCVLFFNELDLLDIRLHELSAVVDKFVIVEADRTFTGQPKPLYFAMNRARYAKFLPRIRHVVITDDIMTRDPWMREAFQRNAIMRGLRDAVDDDVILIGDVDEIPRARTVEDAAWLVGRTSEQVACIQTLHTYYVNSRCTNNAAWAGTQAIRYDRLKSLTPQGVRSKRHDAPQHVYGGWHYSSVGGLEMLQQKLNSFSHQEANTPQINNPEHLARCMAELKDPMGRTDVQFALYEGDDYPVWLWENRAKFPHLFYPGSIS